MCPITQQYEYGCGIACFAFAAGLTYEAAAGWLGPEQSRSTRFWCKDLAAALNKYGKSYQVKYVKPAVRPRIYEDGVIVLISRSKTYPVGHYLIRHQGEWMDPWINLKQDKDITHARAGFRKRLPGRPMYALLPLH